MSGREGKLWRFPVTRGLALVALGMFISGAILWQRVSYCRANSPTGQCAILIDSGGVNLAAIQWPDHTAHPKERGDGR